MLEQWKGLLACVILTLLSLARAEGKICEGDGLSDIFKGTLVHSQILETPPSTTNYTVYFNPCGPIDPVEGCAPDDRLCVIETVLHKNEWVKWAVRSYGSAANGAESFLDFFYDKSLPHPVKAVYYTNARWGDTELFIDVGLICDPSKGDLTLTTRRTDDRWGLHPEVRGAKICSLPGYARERHGWGFFKWLLFLVSVAIVGCGGFVVYLNLQKSGRGGMILEDAREMLKDLPYLFQALVRKIKGLFVGHESAGYNAI